MNREGGHAAIPVWPDFPAVADGAEIVVVTAREVPAPLLQGIDPEPLPPGHPLWSTKNVVITPHISASSVRQMERFWLVVRENLHRHVNGERMLNVVDLQRGY